MATAKYILLKTTAAKINLLLIFKAKLFLIDLSFSNANFSSLYRCVKAKLF